MYGLIKTQVPNQMSITPDYVPRLSLPYIARQFVHYYSILLWDRPVHMGPMFAGLAALLLLGFMLRNRAMVFGLLFANITLISVSVIPGRAGFVW